MSRSAQHRSGTRPPTRNDSRRPGGNPPRTPGGTPTRTAPGGGRPPGSRGAGSASHTRPTDNRPASGPDRGPRLGTDLGRGLGRGPGPAGTATSGTSSSPKGMATRTAPTTSPAADHNHVSPARTGAPFAPATTVPNSPDALPGAIRPASLPSSGAHPAVHPGTGTRHAALPRVPAQAVPAALPQPHPTGLFADRLLAVLSGERPVHWMLRHTAGRAYDELAWLAERGLLRARGTRPVVRDIGYCVPRPGAIEAFARIGAGSQVRAMAFRLEQGPDLRWRCTAVELGGIRPPRPTDD
ncbi:Rv3235 family protein [Streptomyces sp. NPDC005648]|uniref:Rv3235 family protein n=1 Tax=Streptomyces sp. NPDC005648 TaxID=3157044 RepID=UPI0033B1D18D